jgi:starch synthase
VFEHPSPRQLLRAIDRALNLFSRKDVWKDLQLSGMKEDFSWGRSASAYVDLYKQVLKQRHNSPDNHSTSPPAEMPEAQA